MLNELKDELEYCRRKWALAREKNNESQIQWNDLRSEFSSRKLQNASNSAESGYSDEHVSDDENSDEESVQVKNVKAIRKAELLAPTSKKLIRVHSISPTRNGSAKKRDLSAPPITTFLNQVFQTTSEIVPTNLSLQASVVSKPVENLDLNYAARSSVVEPKTAGKITVKNVATEGPATSSSGVKPKCVDEVRPRLSRELRKKSVKVKEKKKGEETLEEMFFRLSGQEPPPPEPSQSEEYDDELQDSQEEKFEKNISFEQDVPHLNLESNNVVNESPNVEDISNIILSDEDEERRVQRAARFQRLEDQCQQLIAQVINNSTRGDELNLHLDNVQRRYTPLRQHSKSIDQSDEDGAAGCSSDTMLKQETECLSQREQEYTSRRAERLKRLEEECKEFLNKQNESKIRADEMSNKLDRLHLRYGSQENAAEVGATENCENRTVVLREEEQAYISRRAERLKRLEEQSAELLEKMAQSASRASNIESNLDALHSKFGEKEESTNADSQLGEECSIDDETLNVVDVATRQEDISSLLVSNSTDLVSNSNEISENDGTNVNEETNTQNDTNNSN